MHLQVKTPWGIFIHYPQSKIFLQVLNITSRQLGKLLILPLGSIFLKIYSPSRRARGNWDKWLCHLYSMFYKYTDRMKNYHYVFSSWNHCAMTVSYMFNILFVRSRRSGIFQKDRIEKELIYKIGERRPEYFLGQ